ncbi:MULTISPECIES: short-chain fatty acid transporter [Bacillaceae]|uniref:Short-chain fatty acid transporter n=2 Tax=Bacillaceae TaxID=186817 RepID=A0A9D5HX49_9BACI|nr:MULTISPECIES: short-chain fatty acid transporter [Bacillaceae]KQL56370.1 short-chain fatty acid transporter [Alkalicoccobacillus plakortidis]MBG9782720.1 short-chain fatty acid transporter [Shouchella lehensis]RQW21813.1 short-chain fatty acid transporter [Bacillus sp. C1-1]TES47660.1 short-chain fatty acid transporter [Shouchella lehensis]
MFGVVIRFFDRIVQRYLPDAFIFALLLTIVVFVLGLGLTSSGPMDMIQYWGGGFWDLLAFTMQMTLIVVTGYILASTNVMSTLMKRLALLAHTPGQAVVLVTVVASLACLLNYGFGLVVGALFAKHVVRRVPTVDYRLLIAAAYSGFLVWHGGLSASIPLTIASEDHFLVESLGIIPVTQTLLSPYNIFIVATLIATLPIINYFSLKSIKHKTYIDPLFLETELKNELAVTKDKAATPAERLENSHILSFVIGGAGMLFVVFHFATNGLDLNINIVNFTILFLGILFHRTPKRLLQSVNEGVKNAGGIIIQFPFYAGIMGMMVASGLSDTIALWFVQISTETTLPFLTFISAGLINMFIPSGGGQWAVQGPIMIPAAIELGADTARVAMAVAWGDAWTNMIQPFWALPVLAIAGLKVRDIMGFCLILLIWSFVPISIGLLFF